MPLWPTGIHQLMQDLDLQYDLDMGYYYTWGRKLTKSLGINGKVFVWYKIGSYFFGIL